MSNRVRNLKLVGTTVGIDPYIADYTQHEVYKIGDIVVLDGAILRATADIADAPATLNEANWEQVGGSDAIIITANRTANTWTATKAWNKIADGAGLKTILINDTALNGVSTPRSVLKNSATSVTFEYDGAISNINSHITITILSDGTIASKSISYDATGTSAGYADQTKAALTIKDSDNVTLGVFNGSTAVQVTIPKVNSLTNDEIDDIWDEVEST